MPAQTTFNFVDFSGEGASVAFWTPTLNASNVVTYTDTTLTNQLGDLKAAVDALTLLNETNINVGAARIVSPPTLPTDENAQREQKLQVKYVDTVTGKKYRFEIPGVDRTLVAQVGTDVVDFANNVFMIALVNAFENGYVSELGNPVSVYGAILVGRNN